MRALDERRYESIDKRARSKLGDRTVIDSTRAMLVWEPKRLVPTYAVPLEDIAGEIGAAPAAPTAAEPSLGDPLQLAGRPVLDPSVPFSVRMTEGEPLTIRGLGGDGEAAAFRPSDPALAGYLIVDFDAFDAWYEEEERNLGHPRDPFIASTFPQLAARACRARRRGARRVLRVGRHAGVTDQQSLHAGECPRWGGLTGHFNGRVLRDTPAPFDARRRLAGPDVPVGDRLPRRRCARSQLRRVACWEV